MIHKYKPTREGRVMELMDEGYPPSRIDDMMMLPRGRAHDIVVEYWAEQKKAAERNRMRR